MASIYKNGTGRWTAQVNLGGKRRSKTFDTKAEASKWARGEEAHHDETGGQVKTTAATFADVTTAYVNALPTMSRSKASAIAHVRDLLGRRKVADLDVQAFRDFARERETEGAGPATILQDLSYVGTILRVGGPVAGVATAHALASLSSARAVLRASGTVARPQERTRRPTDAELVALRDYWAKRRRGIPMWTLTCFATATAMRLSEVCRIEHRDVDTAARTVIIRDRKHPRSKKGNDQKVPLLCGPCVIAGETVDPAALIAAQPREPGEPRVFPYDPATVSTSFTRAVAACGIADLHYHDLRHDGVSRLFEAGYRIEEVSLVSGHRDWSMLRRYTNLDAASLHRPAPGEDTAKPV